MSIGINMDRLNRYFDYKTAELPQNILLNPLYNDYTEFYITPSHLKLSLVRNYPRNDLYYTLAIMRPGSNGIAYFVRFPIRCISESEKMNLSVFVQAVNEKLPVGRLALYDDCLYWGIGVNTEHIAEKNVFNYYYLGGYLRSVIKPLSILTPFIVSAMLGDNAAALAQQAAEACTRSQPEAEDNEECEEYHELVQAWKIDLSDETVNDRLQQAILKYRTRRKEIDRQHERGTHRFSLHRPACADSHILNFQIAYGARENGIYCTANCPVTSLAKSDSLRLFLDKINPSLPAGKIDYLFMEPHSDNYYPDEHEAYISVGLGLKLDDADETDVAPLLDEAVDYLEKVIVMMGEAHLNIIGGGDAEAVAQACLEKLPVWTGGFTPVLGEDMPVSSYFRCQEEASDEANP